MGPGFGSSPSSSKYRGREPVVSSITLASSGAFRAAAWGVWMNHRHNLRTISRIARPAKVHRSARRLYLIAPPFAMGIERTFPTPVTMIVNRIP